MSRKERVEVEVEDMDTGRLSYSCWWVFLVPVLVIILACIICLLRGYLEAHGSFLWLYSLSYVCGYAFSLAAGGALIYRVSLEMHCKVDRWLVEQEKQKNKGKREFEGRDPRPFKWFPLELGLIEGVLYTTSWVIKKPEFIAVWLAVKIGARWAIRKDDPGESPHRLYPTLTSTLLCVAYGVVGGAIIGWLRWQHSQWYAPLAMTLMVVGTWALIFHERAQENPSSEGDGSNRT